jgi:hypothetical protein
MTIGVTPRTPKMSPNFTKSKMMSMRSLRSTVPESLPEEGQAPVARHDRVTTVR